MILLSWVRFIPWYDIGGIMAGVACEGWNAYPSGAPDFTSGFHRGSCCPVTCVSLFHVIVLSFVFWVLIVPFVWLPGIYIFYYTTISKLNMSCEVCSMWWLGIKDELRSLFREQQTYHEIQINGETWTFIWKIEGLGTKTYKYKLGEEVTAIGLHGYEQKVYLKFVLETYVLCFIINADQVHMIFHWKKYQRKCNNNIDRSDIFSPRAVTFPWWGDCVPQWPA